MDEVVYRNDVLTTISECISYMGGHPYSACSMLKKRINALPTVDAVPVRYGRWNCSDDVYESAVCSVCGWDTTEPWVYIKEWFEFCPHCGADMRKDVDDGKTD